MLNKEDYAVIKSLKGRGVYQKDIAEELGVHPKTVRRALKRGGPPDKRRKKRGSKLDPYKATVDRLLKEGVWNAVVILREIQAEGYTGGYTILREYIQPKRALRSGKATVRFETDIGEQLQSDWGETEIGGELTRVILDNLNTHKPASLYETFPPAEARRILKKLAFHYTPKHGSWLNMAEIELSVFSRRLKEYFPDDDTLASEVKALTNERNNNQASVDWRFRTEDPRIKLKRLYPSIPE